MKFIFCILCVLSWKLWAESPTYNIRPSVRFTLDREGSASPLVYYFSKPDAAQDYPILVLCEGSSSKEDLGSVFFIREYFSEEGPTSPGWVPYS